MKKLKSIIKKLFLIALIFILCASVIDYLRINSNKLPIFTRTEYNKVTRIQQFKSLVYSLERTISINEDETLNLSKDIKYKILFKDIAINLKKQKNNKEYIVLKSKDNCKENAKLYYYNPKTRQKVYTYCLSNIRLKETKDRQLNELLDKDEKLLDTIFDKLMYGKTASKDYSEHYNDTLFKEITTTGITAIKCKNNDVYFADENITIPADFCTDKKDTFKYHFEIVDESNETTCPKQTPTCQTQPETCLDLTEVFYQDEKNNYILSCKKSHLIYLVTKTETGEIDQKFLLKEALNNHIVTIDDLKEKGLKFKKEPTISET